MSESLTSVSLTCTAWSRCACVPLRHLSAASATRLPRCSAVARSEGGGTNLRRLVRIRLGHRPEEAGESVEILRRTFACVIPRQQSETDPDHPMLHREQIELLQRVELVTIVGRPSW